jgi:hypothetical protein
MIPEEGDITQAPKLLFHVKDRTMDNVQNCDSYINIHRHKPIDLINFILSIEYDSNYRLDELSFSY